MINPTDLEKYVLV